MSLHKLSAGSGYTYLTRQVAADDVTVRGRGSLGEYYAERGESPGVWLGAGLASLEGGPRPGDPVTEAQMVALFGHGYHPNSDHLTGNVDIDEAVTALGTPFVTAGPRTSVAGYDLTFSPVKSVSALWALADPEIAGQIEAAHAAAVADVIGWLERTAVYTRLGTGGVRQVDVTGLLAVAFTHRDSRTGDPDLHTHVAISNKVRTLDGRWRALDGRPLHAAVVAASERYNTRLEAQLVDRLGVTFTDRPTRRGTRPVRELAGVPVQLTEAWSTRRASIVSADAVLVDRFRATYGREPDRGERQALAQQATLATRPGKHGPRSLAEQRATWRAQAERLFGPGAGERVADLALHRPVIRRTVPAGWAERAAATAVATVSAERAVFGPHHVRAELERLARADRLPLRALDPALDAAMAVALSEEASIRVDGDSDPDGVAVGAEPAGLRRHDGTSVYTPAHTQLYTTAAVLDAEWRILTAADRSDGRRVSAGLVELALLEARTAGHPLNPGQQTMVRELACSGRLVQVALAPAGTGKTTALGVLAAAWTDAGGTVLGTTPSAVAATALGRATGQPAMTLASALRSLHPASAGVPRIGGIPVGPGLLVLVDEAGMAATTDLAELIDTVTATGGSVRLVGDTAQLSSPAAGGILRDLVRLHGAVELDAPVRFADPAEAAATLAIRAGDPGGLDFYAQHDRIHAAADRAGGDPTVADDPGRELDSALAAWAADRAAGRDSLLLGGSNTVVSELNARARVARLLTDGGSASAEVPLRDGTAASPGDLVLARHNERDLPLGGREWVKNGDRFTVLAVRGDGGLHVRHTSGRSLTLPAHYVAEHLQLGYAATIHLAQGTTVDTTHTVLTGRESRQQLYVALTRGRHANHLHLAPTSAGDQDDAAHLTLARAEQVYPGPLELPRDVLARSDARPSAISALTDAADPNRQLHIAVGRYLDAHAMHAATAGRPDEASPATGGPLPWLPPPPDPDPTAPDRGQLADYVQRCADLVHALAAGITADQLPATAWADQLRGADPDLARTLAVWRAATGRADQPQPLGPAVRPDLPGWAQFADRLRPHFADRRATPEHPAVAQRLTLARSQQLADQHRRLADHRNRHRGTGIHR